MHLVEDLLSQSILSAVSFGERSKVKRDPGRDHSPEFGTARLLPPSFLLEWTPKGTWANFNDANASSPLGPPLKWSGVETELHFEIVSVAAAVSKSSSSLCRVGLPFPSFLPSLPPSLLAAAVAALVKSDRLRVYLSRARTARDVCAPVRRRHACPIE